MDIVIVEFYCLPLQREVGFEDDLQEFFNERGYDFSVASYSSITHFRTLTFVKDITLEDKE